MSLSSGCGNCASRKLVMLLPSASSSKQIFSLSGCRASTSAIRKFSESEDDKQLEQVEKGKRAVVATSRRRRKPFLMISSALTPPAAPSDSLIGSIICRSFHYRPLIQLCIQHSNTLFEALQKRHVVPVVSRTAAEDRSEYFFKIPDELRRLKPNSLKWLLEVWPSGSKSYSSRSTIKSVLQNEVAGDDQEMKQMVSKTQSILRTASEQQLYDVLDYLKSRDFAIRRLIKIPWLLTADLQALESSVKFVHKVLNVKDFNVAISFANQNHAKLYEVALLWRREQFVERQPTGQVFKNRVEWMAWKLQCPCEEVSDMMARFPKLMTLPIKFVGEMLDTLMAKFEVKAEAIISDPWAFNTTIKSALKRGQFLKEKGFPMALVKPWLFRCPMKKFDQYVDRQLELIELLGDHKGITGFLHEKLECPKGGNVAEEMLVKVPALKGATVIKLNEMIEFLFSVGFTKQQIRETPRILAHSVETIAERLQEITPFTHPVDNLQVLCRTSKDYRAILRKLKRGAAVRKRSKNSEKSVISSN